MEDERSLLAKSTLVSSADPKVNGANGTSTASLAAVQDGATVAGKENLLRRSASPSSSDEIRVLVGSFNLATRIPTPPHGNPPSLVSWLAPPSSILPAAVIPDVVVVGFQELISQFSGARLPLGGSCHGDADAQIKRSHGRLEFLDPWIDVIKWDLSTVYGGDKEHGGVWYEPIVASRMVALGLLVLVRRGDGGDLINVKRVWEGEVGTGMLGKYPNKGCIAIGLDIEIHRGDSRRTGSLCFANSHLGPHEGHKHYTGRNEEIRHILDTLVLLPRRDSDDADASHDTDDDEEEEHEYIGVVDDDDEMIPAARQVDDFNAAFFFGDLNYRLMGAGVSDKSARREFRAQVTAHIDAGDVTPLLALDELTNIRDFEKFPPLTGWMEPDITFLPSYKHKVITGLLPHIAEKQQEEWNKNAEARYAETRVPAFCDRIMYRGVDHARSARRRGSANRPCAPGWIADDEDSETDELADWEEARQHTAGAISPLFYTCAHDVLWSDHKPVAAHFSVDLDLASRRPHPSRVITRDVKRLLVSWARDAQFRRFREAAAENSTVWAVATAIMACIAAASFWFGLKRGGVDPIQLLFGGGRREEL
ncbi:hypothetical protein HKX48_006489 [Thoreauomyces humboldtii]|nr:hypothetical protein HKX48_006489 [Thoreauomyces humboldtii]